MDDAFAVSVGDARITRVQESVGSWHPAEILPSVDNDVLQDHRSWLDPRHVSPDGRLLMAIQSILLAVDELKIVVDTGVGTVVGPGLERIARLDDTYLTEMATAGFGPHEVDFVICTHLHVDHVGWNIKRSECGLEPTFPRAQYLFVSEALEDFARGGASPDRVGTFGVVEVVEVVEAAGLAHRVRSDHRVSDSVRLIPTPGHTPGHVSVLVESRGERALITGDMIHHPVQWAEPQWHNVSDVDPGRSTLTRRETAERYADGHTVFVGTHFADPIAGRLIRHGSAYRFVTLEATRQGEQPH